VPIIGSAAEGAEVEEQLQHLHSQRTAAGELQTANDPVYEARKSSAFLGGTYHT
jgi:hypothetical protein